MYLRKLILFAVYTLMQSALFAQTLFTYGNKAASKQEFIRSFNRSPVQENDRNKALKEYLPLYINYKLKVQAGYDEHLNKDNSFQLEAGNFKKQLADNFINEEANENTCGSGMRFALHCAERNILCGCTTISHKPGRHMESRFLRYGGCRDEGAEACLGPQSERNHRPHCGRPLDRRPDG